MTEKDEKKTESKDDGVPLLDSNAAFDMYISACSSPNFRLTRSRSVRSHESEKREALAKYRRCAAASIILGVLTLLCGLAGILLKVLVNEGVLSPTDSLQTGSTALIAVAMTFFAVAIIVDCCTRRRFNNLRKTLKKRKIKLFHSAKPSNPDDVKKTASTHKNIDRVRIDVLGVTPSTSVPDPGVSQSAVMNSFSVTVPMQTGAVVSVRPSNSCHENQCYSTTA
ncbi:uncharacterized protein [Ptychodera flava]|uniref:uncharacterized protein n=1 Tax=Ptychodera flava TaxID=63121 RepID=UPI003969D132